MQGNNKQKSKDASSAGEESAVDNLAGSIWVLRGESLRTQVGRPAILSAHMSGHYHIAHTAQSVSAMLASACSRLPLVVRAAGSSR